MPRRTKSKSKTKKANIFTLPKSKIGTIYFIHARGTNRYKIGLTTRPFEERFKELNSSQSAYPLEAVKTVLVKNVNEAESQLHKHFGDYRRHGEWFEFNKSQVETVKQEMSRIAQTSGREGKGIKDFIMGVIGITLLGLMLNYCQGSHKEQPKHNQPAIQHRN